MVKPSRITASPLEEELIGILKRKFLCIANENRQLYYEEDIEDVENDDWWAHRFILSTNGNMEKAFERLNNAMKWRKSFDIKGKRNCSLLEPWYTSQNCKAPDGSIVIVTQFKYMMKVDKHIKAITENHIAQAFQIMDKVNVDGKGVICLQDLSGLNFMNISFDILKFWSDLEELYYPKLVNKNIAYNLSFIITSTMKLFKSLIPERWRSNYEYITASELGEYICEEYIPNYMGRVDSKAFIYVPENVISAKEFAKTLDCKQNEIDAFCKAYENIVSDVRSHNPKVVREEDNLNIRSLLSLY